MVGSQPATQVIMVVALAHITGCTGNMAGSDSTLHINRRLHESDPLHYLIFDVNCSLLTIDVLLPLSRCLTCCCPWPTLVHSKSLCSATSSRRQSQQMQPGPPAAAASAPCRLGTPLCMVWRALAANVGIASCNWSTSVHGDVVVMTHV